MTTDQPTAVDASFADPYFLIGYIDAIARDTGYRSSDAEALADIVATLDTFNAARQGAGGIGMTGPAHYAEAERLLVHVDMSVKQRYEGVGAECARQELAAAQIHATLALVAATTQHAPTRSDPGRGWDPTC